MSYNNPNAVVPTGGTVPLASQLQPSAQSQQPHHLHLQSQSDAAIAPGWYRDQAAGVQRWWDGRQWTQHVAPQAPPAQQFAVQAPPAQVYPAQYVAQQPPYAQTVIVQQKRGVNHALHLVLTILTVGLWAPVWIILAIANS